MTDPYQAEASLEAVAVEEVVVVVAAAAPVHYPTPTLAVLHVLVPVLHARSVAEATTAEEQHNLTRPVVRHREVSEQALSSRPSFSLVSFRVSGSTAFTRIISTTHTASSTSRP